MKKILCLIIAILCFSGCGQMQENLDNNQGDNPNKNINWQEIYLNAFKEGKIKQIENIKIQFIDKDFDNVPELYYEYVDKSSEQYLSSKGNEDGLSLYIGSYKIFDDNLVNLSDSGESTGEKYDGYRFTFSHLLKTGEYVWGVQSSISEMRLYSPTTKETYSANPQRGTETGKSEIIFEPVGIYTPGPISVNSLNIDDEFMKGYNKAVQNYIPNDTLIDKLKNKADGSSWADAYYREITKKDLLFPYANSKIAFVDIDDNGYVDMVYAYQNEGKIVVKTYKYTESGDVVSINVANGVPTYGNGYTYDLALNFAYVNILERYGWVLTKPSGQVLITDDFTVDKTKVFYVKGDKGMAQYDKYVICELKDNKSAGSFTTIDTTKFDEEFNKNFKKAVESYVPNSELK